MTNSAYKSVADTYKTREKFAQLDLEMFQRLQAKGLSPQVIYDVGASDGSWSRDIVEVFPQSQFYLFEPLVNHAPAYQQFMTESLKLHDNFHLYGVALGEREGTVTLNVFPNLVASTALPMEGSGLALSPVTVPVLTLDGLVKRGELPIPQIIKIDTQGYEWSILKGAVQILPQVSVLLLECWLYRGYGPQTPLFTELANWLLGLGFRLWDLGDEYRDERGGLATVDCLFLNVASDICPAWHY